MVESLTTGQLQQSVAQLVSHALGVHADVAVLQELVEATGLELSVATRHEIELELHDAAVALHRVALSVREQRRSCDAHAGNARP